MRILLLSNDQSLSAKLQKPFVLQDNELKIDEQSTDPLDVMSTVCTQSPPLLIVDDDYLKPNSAHILKSIKKINKEIKIIFLTSDPSVELGREISPIGVHYYGLKPMTEKALSDLIKSVSNKKTINN
ncbi:MAG: hypothetical protein KAQ90_07280 [Melioribacteraceae bacterium]|nr:hypothetical protein [Melioribacteraceae bacterium]